MAQNGLWRQMAGLPRRAPRSQYVKVAVGLRQHPRLALGHDGGPKAIVFFVASATEIPYDVVFGTWRNLKSQRSSWVKLNWHVKFEVLAWGVCLLRLARFADQSKSASS